MAISPKTTVAKPPTSKTPSAAPKKSARSSNLSSLVRSLSKVSLVTTLTATQKRKQRRQRAKLLAQRDGCKDLRGALKIQKEDVKKTSSGKSKTAQNGQNQKKKQVTK